MEKKVLFFYSSTLKNGSRSMSHKRKERATPTGSPGGKGEDLRGQLHTLTKGGKEGNGSVSVHPSFFL